MSLLSKSEVQFLRGNKEISKSYEYKLKSIIKKKLANLIEKELPLLDSLFPNLDLTKFSKNFDSDVASSHIAKNSKTASDNHHENISRNSNDHINPTRLNHDKLYNCADFIHPKGVRSVVRISRRSSEPQVMGSKPTGPVIHMGSNNSWLYKRLDKRRRFSIAR